MRFQAGVAFWVALGVLAPLAVGTYAPGLGLLPVSTDVRVAAFDRAEQLLNPITNRALFPDLETLPLHPHHVQSLALARDLLAIDHAYREDVFAEAVALGKRASLGQAEMLGYAPADPIGLEGLALPSDALFALTARLGIAPSSPQSVAILGLDGLEEPVRGALAGFVDAFLALDKAATVDVDLVRVLGIGGQEALDTLRASPESLVGLTMPRVGVEDAAGWGVEARSPAEELASVGVDWPRLFPTRIQFLDAISTLRNAVEAARPFQVRECFPVQVPLAFSIDLEGCDTLYSVPYVLSLDLGGNDRYYNNAGGSNIYGGFFCGLLPGGRAALVDLGGGSDAYGDPSNLRACGVNGGGYIGGMGFVLDEGGDDMYVSDYAATGGGAEVLGNGFVLDVDGNDSFVSGGGRSRGGGGAGGVGMLINVRGDDTYVGFGGATGGAVGVNIRSFGFLIDMQGNDEYVADDDGYGGGTNGGALYNGEGFLLDGSGDDVYVSGHAGTNGGGTGERPGVGFLLDAGGNDSYSGTYYGVNGGGELAGRGMLVDLGGDDRYSALAVGVNGGGCSGGIGSLVDLGGDDAYTATFGGANGGGGLCRILNIPVGVGVGSLVDTGGRDVYWDNLTDCVDCSVVPKDVAGVQLDLSGPG